MTMVLDRIRRAARAHPDSVALRYLADGEAETATLTYGDLMECAGRMAAALRGRGLAGRSAALIVKPGPRFLIALIALMSASMVTAPLPLPRGPAAVRRTAGALRALRPAAIVCDDPEDVALKAVSADAPRLGLDALLAQGADPTPNSAAPPSGGDMAIIQFSSGSTAEPRGVVISHRNIAANIDMITLVSGTNGANPAVTWLPHTHDMGLFGTLLTPLCIGATIVQMPPDGCCQTNADKSRNAGHAET
ncbi:MAG: AMP-binding protein [Oceanicaulis sp.]